MAAGAIRGAHGDAKLGVPVCAHRVDGKSRRRRARVANIAGRRARLDVTGILHHRAALSGAVARIALPRGVGRVCEGRAREAHEAPMAGHAILCGRHMDRCFRNRGDAIKGQPIMAARAIRADARVVHWRVGKGHGVCVTGVAGSRGWKVTGRHALRQGPVVAGNAPRWRSLQHAIDVAGHAFDGRVSARQRKDGLGMIETRSHLLCRRRNRDEGQKYGADAAEPSKSIHVSPRAMQLRLKA